MSILGVDGTQLLHIIIAVLCIAIVFLTEDALSVIMAIVGFFYGLFNYCESINLKNIKE